MGRGFCCRVDMVLVGAEGVVENGGVINKLGTFQAALAASCHNIPFYVAAESYKVLACLTSPSALVHLEAVPLVGCQMYSTVCKAVWSKCGVF